MTKLLFCSLGKELHPAHGNCTCYTHDEDVHCSFPRKNLGQFLFYSVQSSTQEEHPIQNAISPTTTRAFLNRTIPDWTPSWGSISWQLGTLKPSETPAPENVESRRGSNMFECLVRGVTLECWGHRFWNLTVILDDHGWRACVPSKLWTSKLAFNLTISFCFSYSVKLIYC